MYKHILLPTDGSRLSEQAAAAGIALAKSLNARVTALHVLPETPRNGLEAWAHHDERYARKMSEALQKRAVEYLNEVRETALKQGVQCECAVVRGESVHREIIQEARSRGCDLIMMASHGHDADAGTILGSETVKVATLGGVPVLVHRRGPATTSRPKR